MPSGRQYPSGVVDIKLAVVASRVGKVDNERVFRKKIRGAFGPFDDADMAGVEEFLIAEAGEFFRSAQTVEVEMIEGAGRFRIG